ncbi:SRPBCC family protein [Pendulispora albinea]|uniref:SRPBCC family protein n=1 Tax=Pendulispora albinea TaxID=2741071 RepID=A0ABZ2LLL4_9BACT
MAIDIDTANNSDPIIKVRLGSDGRPRGAAAVARIDRPVGTVWAAVQDVERYARYLPMVHRVRRQGDHVSFELKFKVGFFSVGFEFSAHATYEPEQWLELRWTSGEPRDIRLRFDLKSIDDGKACLVEGNGEFDASSLGWLVKYFLKHHPEIQFGIFPGVALVLIDSLRRATMDAA